MDRISRISRLLTFAVAVLAMMVVVPAGGSTAAKGVLPEGAASAVAAVNPIHEAAATNCPAGWSQVNYNSSAQMWGQNSTWAKSDVTACQSGSSYKYVVSVWGSGLTTPYISGRFWICNNYGGSFGARAWSFTTTSIPTGGCSYHVDNLNTTVNTIYSQPLTAYYYGTLYAHL